MQENEFFVWIQEEGKPIIIGEFKNLTISLRDDTVKSKKLEDKVNEEVQIAYIFINQSLWNQYSQEIIQRSRRFNIIFDNKDGRYELVRCCCDVPKFIETNKIETGLITKVEGIAERFLQYSETIKQFKDRVNYE